MHSLRDVGYDLPSAVADLIDNSIDAGADEVHVDAGVNWRGAYLRIADNGTGMSERRLEEAMRYGSSRSYFGDDLGYFGLGLKTASLSQCRCLTVASRSTLRGRIRIRRWDLDEVSSSDSWLLERPRILHCRDELAEPLENRVGTVVMWEKMDRILGNRRPDGDAARRKLTVVAEELRLQLGMVFHRFLARRSGPRRLRILLNEKPVKPWDPFARSEPMTQDLPVQRLDLEHDGDPFRIRVKPYVLPAQHHFSNQEAHELAGGPNRWNRQQGLYIYRHDRLIQSGGWNRLRTLDEHSKLARIAIDIPEGADEAFRTNVAKMSVGIPDALRPQLRVLIAGVVKHAQDTYRQRVRLVSDTTTPAPAENASAGGIVLGDQWPVIVEILEREMADHPDLLDRVLVALANAPPVGDVSAEVSAAIAAA
jgi:hypothetical protein